MTTTLAEASNRPLLPILVALSCAHLLNDLIQSMIPAMYPLLKEAYRLDFAQIGLITLAWQLTASLMQPVVGYALDRRPWPYAMIVGMTATLTGLLGLAFANSYAVVILSAALAGFGSAVFHPEATRMARHAAAGQQGFGQGIFQIGGHAGYALGPLIAAALVVPRGLTSLAWLSLVALAAMALMAWTGTRYAAMRRAQAEAKTQSAGVSAAEPRARHLLLVMAILITLLFANNAYSSAFSSYYTFYLIERFGVSVQASQIMLFLYLVVGAFGVIAGGMLGDRVGRRHVIWVSILGALPFALLLPYADLIWTGVLSILISLIMASAFASILIYAIDLVPHRIGFIGGLFYGLAFGLGGLAAAALGMLADRIGIVAAFNLCAWLPAIGLLTFFLPRSPTSG